MIALAAGLATAGRAATPALTFTLNGSPPQVTPGGFIGYSGQITNTGAVGVSNLVLVESVPGVGPVQFKTFSHAVPCVNLSGGGIKCALGSLAAPLADGAADSQAVRIRIGFSTPHTLGWLCIVDF